MNPVPATISIEIGNRLNELRVDGLFIMPDNMEWRRLKRECEALLRVDAVEGWSNLGKLYVLSGDVAEMEHCFANAIRLSGSLAAKFNLMASYFNLGLHAKAAAIYEEIGDPSNGLFENTLDLGLYLGCFQSAKENIFRAKEMQLDLQRLPINIALRASDILSRAEMTDKQVTDHIDAAGKVLRDHRFFQTKRSDILAIDVEDVMQAITMVIYIKCTPENIFYFNVELAKAENDLAIEKNSAFEIVFAAA